MSVKYGWNNFYCYFFSMQKAEYINSKVCDIHLVFLRHKKQRILPEEESFGHEADRFVPECNLPSHVFVFKPNKIVMLSIHILHQFSLNLLMEALSYILFNCRAKLMDLCVQIVSLLQSHCLLNLTRVYNVVGKQIS